MAQEAQGIRVQAKSFASPFLKRLKQLRIIDQDKGLWIDFNGNQVSLSDSPDLPY